MFYLWVGFNSRWGSIVSIFVFDWGSINIFMGWGCNQEWGSNGADTVIDGVGITVFSFTCTSMT